MTVLMGVILLVLTASIDHPRRAVPAVYHILYGADGLYEIDVNGDYWQQLAPQVRQLYDTPAVALDGSQIAFIANDECGFPALYRLDLAASTILHVLDSSSQCLTDFAPPVYRAVLWSPDHEYLVLVYKPGFSNYPAAPLEPPSHLMRLSLMGGGLKRVTAATPEVAEDHPAWSLDGQWLVYVQRGSLDSATTGSLWRVRPDGTENQIILHEDASYALPQWSPDGQWIYFMRAAASNWDIYRVRPDGADLQALTTFAGYDGQPALSPDGAWLAFISEQDGDREVYRMRPDGSTPQKLTRNGGEDTSPRWSPDGRWIAFVSYRPGARGIYVMRPDGTDERWLVDRYSPRWFPTWIAQPQLPWQPLSLWGLGVVLVGVGVALALRVHHFRPRQRIIG